MNNSTALQVLESLQEEQKAFDQCLADLNRKLRLLKEHQRLIQVHQANQQLETDQIDDDIMNLLNS